MFEVHGYKLYQEILKALKLVKDEWNQVGGVFNFDITHSLLDEVELPRSRCEADRIERKPLKEEEFASKKEKLDEIT